MVVMPHATMNTDEQYPLDDLELQQYTRYGKAESHGSCILGRYTIISTMAMSYNLILICYLSNSQTDWAEVESQSNFNLCFLNG